MDAASLRSLCDLFADRGDLHALPGLDEEWSCFRDADHRHLVERAPRHVPQARPSRPVRPPLHCSLPAPGVERGVCLRACDARCPALEPVAARDRRASLFPGHPLSFLGAAALSKRDLARLCAACGELPLLGGSRLLDGELLSATMSSIADLDRSKVVEVDLGGSELKQNARGILAQWARRPPFYVFSNGPPQVVCGRYADVHEVFSDTERFSSEVPRGRGFEQFDKFMGVQFITQMDGERHARIRRLLMPAFSSRSLARLETRIEEIIEGMLDRIEAGGNEFDGMRDYGAQLVVGALLTAMANLNEREKEIFLALHEVLPRTTYTRPGEPFAPECVRAFEGAADLVHEIIAQRRAHPRADFINDLITARDAGDRLTDRELFDQIFTICVAALSATSRA